MDPHATTLPFADRWSLILGLVGKGFIFLAIGGFLVSAVLWMLARRQDDSAAALPIEKFAKLTFWLGAVGIFGGFASLATLFLTEQFQFKYVFEHSAAGLPSAYRIAAVWSGQQGSFLLWATTSTIFALLVAPFTGKYRRGFSLVYGLFLASLAAILAYETPFNIIQEAIKDSSHVLRPPSGVGLTPALQNYWVIIHPPTIFLGFGSLTVMFAWAISAMIERDGKSWISMVRPWALLSGSILGLGLCMGGFWAYETLGWGGFWAWDPVENVSFVPWIFTIAFYHGIIVQTVRGRWIGTNLLMGGLPFLVFTFGTLMTRSGLLGESSVHSFAEMNRFALWILAGIMFASGIGLFGYWGARGLKLGKDSAAAPEGMDREKAYFSGVFLLSLIGAVAALGMAWSFFTAIFTGTARIVDAHLYQVVVVWFFIPLLLLLATAPFLGWRKQNLSNLTGRLANIFGISLGITGGLLWLFRNPLWGAGNAGQTRPDMLSGAPVFESARVTLPFGWQVPPLAIVTFLVFLTTFVVVANSWRIAESFRRAKMSIGGFVSHIGVATLMAGLIVSRGLEHHEVNIVPKDHPTKVLDYELTYAGMTMPDDLTNRDNHAKFTVKGEGETYIATPGLYYMPTQDEPEKAMVWPHIQHHMLYDTYLSVGAPMLAATDQPMVMKLGETKDLGDAKVRFVDWHAPKNPGESGAKWSADLEITTPGRKMKASPEMTMDDKGLHPSLTQVNDEVYVSMIAMNASDGSITLQWPLVEPRFPVEFFYKPMTLLVWAGAGILFIGGLLSAFYRRHRVAGNTVVPPVDAADVPETQAP